MGGSPCWEFGFEAQQPIIEELRLKQLCEHRAASFPVALSISVSSESGFELQPSLPRLEFQAVDAVSALKTTGQKAWSRWDQEMHPWVFLVGLAGALQNNPTLGRALFSLVEPGLGSRAAKLPLDSAPGGHEGSCWHPGQGFGGVSSPLGCFCSSRFSLFLGSLSRAWFFLEHPSVGCLLNQFSVSHVLRSVLGWSLS